MVRYTLNSTLIFLAVIGITSCADPVRTSAELPFECQLDCVTPYGEIIGVSGRGIEAYSNCNSSCVLYEPNYWEGTYTGIKWQCVEYVRRWLLVNRGAVYDDVNVAADIWHNIDHLIEISTNRKLPLDSHLNGSRQPPQFGDLVVYSREYKNTGHVAVVVDVDTEAGFIEVVEQNYSNDRWPGEFSRKIELIMQADRYWLMDAYLLGWKHIGI